MIIKNRQDDGGAIYYELFKLLDMARDRLVVRNKCRGAQRP